MPADTLAVTGRCLALAFILALAGPVLAAGGKPAAPPPGDGLAVATFAGGCFWCMEPPYDKIDGVKRTVSGYTGGSVERPTYEAVSASGTGHYEAVRVIYDPGQVDYERLLHIYWRNVDPFDAGGQFCDRGPSYRTAIFTHDERQRRLAEQTRTELAERFGKEIATVIEPAERFYPAEDYHQDYYRKNPLRYKFYRFTCGRDDRLEEVWGDAARRGEVTSGASKN
ncbi:peptide-methionine (S)-S-oxide reductase MsrA [Arhodomonas sp. AD133]|uniref:peptide-methionine (S)-S-oxide reductase MsrA n=1 Tax=Arhodomonas sp. AD133 TaxID=3415009 RepID=UPI003EBAC5A7